MDVIVSCLTFMHVFLGFGSLITGFLAMVLKHKTPVHRVFGKLYFLSMTFIFITALPLSILHEKWFLLFIAFFTYYCACIAYRAVVLKTNPRKSLDWAIDMTAGITNAGLLIYGLYLGYVIGFEKALIPLIFGISGIYLVANTIYTYHFKVKNNLDWLRTHIGNMIGSYIGAVTALLVNQAWKWDVPDVVAWIGPAVLMIPLIIREIRAVGAGKQVY